LVLSIDEANALVVEYQGWGESIARAVARAWNLDWQLDGLDGAAMEALVFCSRRYDPARGVPFKGYARKRIHEASTEAAKKSRGWRKSSSNEEQNARELSSKLLYVFPELRMGEMPSFDDSEGDMRSSIRGILVGASILATREGLAEALPDDLVDLKKMLELLAYLEPVHQMLLWSVYWEGISMRGVAEEWQVDELSIIREHKTLLEYLEKSFQKRGRPDTQLKIRPALKKLVGRKALEQPFKRFLNEAVPENRREV
jgi:DNA-directed RNA polymerase specialized sigma subunit